MGTSVTNAILIRHGIQESFYSLIWEQHRALHGRRYCGRVLFLFPYMGTGIFEMVKLVTTELGFLFPYMGTVDCLSLLPLILFCFLFIFVVFYPFSRFNSLVPCQW